MSSNIGMRTGLLACEEACMESCSDREGFEPYNLCVEECMVFCSAAKVKPADISKRL
ncbi:MAG: hypothetical protein ABWW70_00920 [Thermoproteota archaeon]